MRDDDGKVRVPKALREELSRLAKDRGQSMTALVHHILRRAVRAAHGDASLSASDIALLRDVEPLAANVAGALRSLKELAQRLAP